VDDGHAVSCPVDDPKFVLAVCIRVKFKVSGDIQIVACCGDDSLIEAGSELFHIAVGSAAEIGSDSSWNQGEEAACQQHHQNESRPECPTAIRRGSGLCHA